MGRSPKWFFYYSKVLWDAVRVARGHWDGLVSYIGLLFIAVRLFGPQIKGFLGDQIDWYIAKHPVALWMAGLSFFAVAFAIANWRRVKNKDATITKLRRDAGRDYDQLCEACRVLDHVLLTGLPAELDSQDKLDQWIELAKGIGGPSQITAAITLLTPAERLDFSLLEVKGIPPGWGRSDEHRLHFFTLKRIRRLLRRAVQNREIQFTPLGSDTGGRPSTGAAS